MRQLNLVKYLQKTTNRATCPFCEQVAWKIQGERALLQPTPEGKYELPGPIEKYILLVCQQCAFTRLLNIDLIAKDSDVVSPSLGKEGETG